MKNMQEEWGKLLVRFIRMSQRLDEEGVRELSKHLDSFKPVKVLKPATYSEDRGDIFELLPRLKSQKSSGGVVALLDEAKLRKVDLVMLTRELEIHTLKEDKVEDIKQKIAQELVGSRLNSDAIRGKPS
ncbi:MULTISPECIES: hypothetical protein [unclassified Yoonia]|uniref:hypothetical protein n=1 Tax=unclassified Yoonia TaxID=2629118 RepID=UPI002AFFA172|nr:MULTISPECIES: hypothetical protein [unclassified Yoonia]